MNWYPVCLCICMCGPVFSHFGINLDRNFKKLNGNCYSGSGTYSYNQTHGNLKWTLKLALNKAINQVTHFWLLLIFICKSLGLDGKVSV